MINISKLYCGLSGESDDLRYHQPSSSGPVVVYNCTSRCNLKCLHCYSSSDLNKTDDELTTAQAKQLLSQIAQVRCPVILFSGGEPLLRRDLFDLLAEAKHLGLRTAISTNGTLINSSVAKKLVDVGVGYVGISIDGTRDFHDWFRQTSGSFKAALSGIASCRAAGIRTGLRFTITNQNAGQIPAVFDIAAENNIRRLCFYHLIAVGRAQEMVGSEKGQDAVRYTLNADETRRAVDVIIDKTAEFARRGLIDEVLTVDNHADGPYLLLKMAAGNHLGYEQARQLLLANGGNKIAEKIVCVGWDGSVFADQFWRNYSLGNIRDRSLKEIWGDSDEPVLSKLRDKSGFADARCLRCRWFDLCKGNFRFLADKTSYESWLNEPPCYLTDEEIGI